MSVAKGFILPNGKAVGVKSYVKSWKILKSIDPNEEVKGWEWYAVPAWQILRSIRDGIHDRINKNGGLVVRKLSESRLLKLRAKHQEKNHDSDQ